MAARASRAEEATLCSWHPHARDGLAVCNAGRARLTLPAGDPPARLRRWLWRVRGSNDGGHRRGGEYHHDQSAPGVGVPCLDHSEPSDKPRLALRLVSQRWAGRVAQLGDAHQYGIRCHLCDAAGNPNTLVTIVGPPSQLDVKRAMSAESQARRRDVGEENSTLMCRCGVSEPGSAALEYVVHAAAEARRAMRRVHLPPAHVERRIDSLVADDRLLDDRHRCDDPLGSVHRRADVRAHARHAEEREEVRVVSDSPARSTCPRPSDRRRRARAVPRCRAPWPLV